jgi:nucleoporin NDC1
MIFILRVAQLHVGLRTSYSAWDTFCRYAYRFQVVQTIGCYFISAFIFSEIYIWSAGKGADLSRVKILSKADRLTLNEIPIYLTSYLIFLSFAQAGAHLFYDYDRVDLPVTKTKPEASSDERAQLIVPPTTELKTKLPSLVLTSFTRALAMAIVSPLIYSMDWGIYPGSVRRFAWSYTRTWAKMFYHLPKSNALPSVRPFHMSVLGRTVTSGFLLVLLWEVGNAAFSAYTAQEPLKNERPITYESRDPNGSLLTGLKGKKLQTRVSLFQSVLGLQLTP